MSIGQKEKMRRMLVSTFSIIPLLVLNKKFHLLFFKDGIWLSDHVIYHPNWETFKSESSTKKSLKLYFFKNIYWPSNCFILLMNLYKRSIQSLFSKIKYLWMINILWGKSCFNNSLGCFTKFKYGKTIFLISFFLIY